MIYAEIELKNYEDLTFVKRNMIGQEEVRQIRVNMLVDSGSYYLVINENIQAVLQLPVLRKERFRLANESAEEHAIVGPVQVKFGEKTASCDAILLPGDCEPLLGAIPMEALDVLIHPQRQELILNTELRKGRYF